MGSWPVSSELSAVPATGRSSDCSDGPAKQSDEQSEMHWSLVTPAVSQPSKHCEQAIEGKPALDAWPPGLTCDSCATSDAIAACPLVGSAAAVDDDDEEEDEEEEGVCALLVLEEELVGELEPELEETEPIAVDDEMVAAVDEEETVAAAVDEDEEPTHAGAEAEHGAEAEALEGLFGDEL